MAILLRPPYRPPGALSASKSLRFRFARHTGWLFASAWRVAVAFVFDFCGGLSAVADHVSTPRSTVCGVMRGFSLCANLAGAAASFRPSPVA